MADTQSLSAEERFEASCAARGLTTEDVRRIGSTPSGLAVLHEIAKEAGINEAEHSTAIAQTFRTVGTLPLALLGAVAGGGLGAAAVPLRQLATASRVSWRAFAQQAPMTTAIGAVVGTLAGLALVKITNRHNSRMREAATEGCAQMERTWAEREEAKVRHPPSPMAK